MLKRCSVVLSVLLIVSACSEGPIQPDSVAPDLSSSAEIVDGLPGQQPILSALINASGETVFGIPHGFCAAGYADPTVPSQFVGNALSDPVSEIHITENKAWVIVTCKFTDVSGIYEANAEVGKTFGCGLALPDGEFLAEGTGSLTVAANNDPDGADGGNAMLRCKFENTGGGGIII